MKTSERIELITETTRIRNQSLKRTRSDDYNGDMSQTALALFVISSAEWYHNLATLKWLYRRVGALSALIGENKLNSTNALRKGECLEVFHLIILHFIIKYSCSVNADIFNSLINQLSSTFLFVGMTHLSNWCSFFRKLCNLLYVRKEVKGKDIVFFLLH